MNHKCISRLGRMLCGGVLLFSAGPLSALEPPTARQIEQYKADGTWAQRVAQARELGNHQTSPALASRLRAKLQNSAKAAGLPAPAEATEMAALPPSGWQGSLPASGTPKILVLLIDFPDYPHGAVQTAADVQSKFFGDGDPASFPSDSLRNYYQRSSYNQLTIQGNVLGWYTAAHNRNYYYDMDTGEGVGREAVIMEAMDYFNDPAHGGHDFTQYDNDGNGQIDCFFVKWTGPIGAWASFWWAYATGWGSPASYRIDGKSLGGYVWSWIAGSTTEAFHVGTDIHETGHMLGLPDYYDYDDSVGPRGGVGGWDVMDGGGDHNCFSKFLLGWLTPTFVVGGTQTLALNPSGTSQDCVLIMPSSMYTSGNWFDEFFMAQYRKRTAGNDSPYSTDGYTIWHVDSTLSGGNFVYNNSYTAHKLLRLMEADGLEDIEAGRGGNTGDLYRAPKSIGPWTTPNSKTYTGLQTGVQVDQLGSASATMTARFAIVGVPVASPAGATLTAESTYPANGILDHQEIVTLNLSLLNTGTTNIADLQATLNETGGVSSPTGPQNYGAMSIGSAAVSRPFSFIVSGECGGILTATLSLTENGTAIEPAVFTFRIGAPVQTLTQNFDSVTAPNLPSGWTAAVVPSGATRWVTSTAARDTLPNSAFAPNPGSVSDNRLESPWLAVTNADAQLTFRHRYDVENGWDACVLEIAIGGGEFTDIVTAGGSFVTGEYTSGFVVPSGWSNPLIGRAGWTGSSGGFITTTVNLPAAAAGQNIKLRWRIGTDSAYSATGWYVDAISVVDGYSCAARRPGDFNADGDADQEDFGRFQACLTADGTPVADLSCQLGRLDQDSDVDQADVVIFQRCHTQANALVDLGCLD